MLTPVVLSGGAGTRLWPLSRELYPKQLLPLAGEKTMLQETLARLEGLPDLAPALVVCNEAHRFMVAEQLQELASPVAAIMLEPVGRNTAPAAAMAALQALTQEDDPLLLVLPADHVIADLMALQTAICQAVEQARAGRLVTFGIVPEGPETGYGYIRAGETLDAEGGTSATAFAVDAFVEKPDAATARRYLDQGGYFWNSGMFLFRASDYLSELEKFAPQILRQCRLALDGAVRDLDFTRMDVDAFRACPSDSIDYAVMEKTDRAAVLPLGAGWSDVGAWSALWEIGERDGDGNLISGDVINVGSRNSYLKAGSRLLATVGVDNLVVVETADAVLVADRQRVQEVKEVVARLKQQQRGEAELHARVNRPWGTYQGVDAGERFQVKRISVKPGASLSLQKHHHRAEHWVVVRGTARVTCGDEVRLIGENQSTYIPLGEVHRLENPGKIPLEIIEVQSGTYLGEDDIVRFEDNYGR